MAGHSAFIHKRSRMAWQFTFIHKICIYDGGHSAFIYKISRMAGPSRSTHKISMMAGHSAVIYKISRMTGQSRSTRKISMIAGNPHLPIKYHMQGNLHFVHNISTMAGQTAFSKNFMEGQSAFIKKIPVYQ